MDESHRAHLEKKREAHLTAIRALELTESAYGLDVPTHVVVELKERRSALSQIRLELEQVESATTERFTWSELLEISLKQVNHQIKSVVGDKYRADLYVPRAAESIIQNFVTHRSIALGQIRNIIKRLQDQWSGESVDQAAPLLEQINSRISDAASEDLESMFLDLKRFAPATHLQMVVVELGKVSSCLRNGDFRSAHRFLGVARNELARLFPKLPAIKELDTLLESPVLTREESGVISRITAAVEDLSRTDPVNADVNLALALTHKCRQNLLIVVDSAGAGKTNLLSHLASEQARIRPTVFLAGSQLRDLSSVAAIEQALLSAFQSQYSHPLPTDALAYIFEQSRLRESDLLIVLDGINSVGDPSRFVGALADFLGKYQNSRIRVCISCRDVYWGYFESELWMPHIWEKLSGNLSIFSSTEYIDASTLYFDAYGISVKVSGNALDRLKHPLLLRLFCETYGNSSGTISADIGEINDLRLKDLLDHYWETKLSSVKAVAGYRTPEPVGRFLLRLADRMLSLQVTSVPKEALVDLAQGDSLESPNSIYVRTLDENVLLEQNLSPDWAEPEVSFVYDELMEYTVARAIAVKVNLRQEGTEPLREITSYATRASSYPVLYGAISYLISFASKGSRVALLNQLLRMGDQWQIAMVAAISRLPLEEISSDIIDSFIIVTDSGNLLARFHLLDLLTRVGLRLPDSTYALLKRLSGDTNTGIRSAVIQTCQTLGSPRSVGLLGNLAADADPLIRLKAIDALSLTIYEGADKIFRESLHDSSWQVRASAVEGIARCTFSDSNLDTIVSILSSRDQHPAVRASAAISLGYLKSRRCIRALINAINDPELLVRENACWALGNIADDQGVPGLRQALRDKYWQVRESAIWALGQMRVVSTVPQVLDALKDRSYYVRGMACETLAVLSYDQSAKVLFDVLTDDHPYVRWKASQALAALPEPPQYLVEKLLDALLNERNAEVCARIVLTLIETGHLQEARDKAHEIIEVLPSNERRIGRNFKTYLFSAVDTTNKTSYQGEKNMSVEAGSIITGIERYGPSEANLLDAYKLLKDLQTPSQSDKKLLAEVCYLLAGLYKKQGQLSESSKYARESAKLYEELKVNSLEDAVPLLNKYLPDIMHEGVVRSTFKES